MPALVHPRSLGILSASPGPSPHVGTTALGKVRELEITPFGGEPPTDLLGDPWGLGSLGKGAGDSLSKPDCT